MRSTPLQVYTNNVSCKTECANIAEDFVGLAVSQNRTFARKNRIQTSKEKVMAILAIKMTAFSHKIACINAPRTDTKDSEVIF